MLYYLLLVSRTSSGANPTTFVAGEVANFNVWMTLTNIGEDAFLTTISFTILTAQFEFIRILPRDVSLVTINNLKFVTINRI